MHIYELFHHRRGNARARADAPQQQWMENSKTFVTRITAQRYIPEHLHTRVTDRHELHHTQYSKEKSLSWVGNHFSLRTYILHTKFSCQGLGPLHHEMKYQADKSRNN